MRRLHPDWGTKEIIDYNLRPKPGSNEPGTAFSIFDNTQHYRVDLTRKAIAKIIATDPDRRWRIIEPACSAGDISGFFSADHDVWMCDVVPAAVAAARQRWPMATVEEGPVEEFEAIHSDILVMCEFLEHIVDPITFVQQWGPLARYMVISHPLVGDGYDPEKGHFWAYDILDFRHWFKIAGHDIIQEQPFRMGYHMILGVGERR